MIRNKVVAFLSLVVLVYVSYGCDGDKTSFYINKKQIIQLLNDSAYSHSFIENWDLKKCHEDSIVKAYCRKDSQIVYVASKTGYFIAIEGLNFKVFENLKYNLRTSFNSAEVDYDEIFRKHLGEYELDFIEYFYNNDFDIFIAKKERQTEVVHVISVNKV